MTSERILNLFHNEYYVKSYLPKNKFLATPLLGGCRYKFIVERILSKKFLLHSFNSIRSINIISAIDRVLGLWYTFPDCDELTGTLPGFITLIDSIVVRFH